MIGNFLFRTLKFIRSNRKKGILIGLSIIVVLTSISALILYWPKNAEAAWFDDNWDYRNRVPITSHTGSENNVYIIVTIDTSASGKFQADCGDLRWTDAGGKILKYYIVSGCTTASTVVHVFFDTFPAGAQNIYYYYGNPGATNGFVTVDFATQATSYVVGTVASQELGGGPVFYSKLNEGTGTTTQDSTNNGSTGTLSGSTTPTWQTEDQCINGKCLFFNGSTGYVSYGKPSVLVGVTQVSISFWAKPSTVSVDTGFINNHHAGLDTDGSWEIRIDNTGIITFQLDGVACSSGKIYQNGNLTSSYTQVGNFSTAVSTKALSANTWTHIEGTASGCSALQMPYNLATGYKELDFSGNPTNFYQGFMDDVKIYNYERTSAQVKSDYISRGSLKGSSATLGANDQNLAALSNGLVGYWKMDESSGDIADSSGNGNTLTNNNTTTFVGGKFGNASSLLNASAQSFSKGSLASSVLALPNTFTLSMWVNPTSFPSFSSGIIKFGSVGSTEQSYRLYASSSTITGFVSTDGSTSSLSQGATYSLSTSTWSLVTWSLDGINSRIYVNGVLLSTQAFTGTPHVPGGGNDQFFIGGTENSRWNGLLDEARVYNRGLSQTEVQQIYSWGPGAVGYWNFEEGTGTSANDSSGNGLTGTLTTSPTWTAGKYGSAINLTPTNSYVSVANNSLLNPTDDMTVEAWVKPAVIDGTTRIIFGKGNNGATTTRQYSFRINTSNQYQAFIYTGSTTNSRSDTVTVPSVNRWDHITMVRRNNALYGYTNGVQWAGSTALSGTTNTTTNVFAIGREGSSSTTYFGGYEDDVRIYNYARTPSQILQDMNANDPSSRNPTGYWKMDEGYGTTTNDSSGNGNNLILSGSTKPSWTNSGKYTKALSFGGSNAYLAAGSDVQAFKIISDLSLSAWINLTDTSSQHDIICKYTGTASTSSYCLTVNSSGKLQMLVTNSTGPANVTTTGSATLSTSTWYHVVGVFNSLGSVTLYINGKQDTQNTTSIPTTLQNPTTILDIGGENAGSNLMNGIIDEAKVYDFALSASDIQLDYNQSRANVLGVLGTNTSYANQAANQQYCVPGDATSCAAPVGEWNFEEGTGTSAQDTSGGGSTGTITGATYQTGKIGKALNFNGSTDAVTVSNSLSTKTVSFWVNPSTTTQNLIDLRTAATAANISVSSGTISASGFTSPTIYVNGAVSSTLIANSWQYVTVTTGTTITSSAIRFGRISSTSLTGKLDSIRIFDYARSAAQIAWDYNQGKPVAQYKFDECQGTVAHDASGNSFNGTIGTDRTIGTCNTSSTVWGDGATGRFNSSLGYDGTGDYTEVSDATALRLTNALTVSAWVKTTGSFSSTASGLVRKDTQGAGTRYFWGLEFYILSGKVTGEYFNGTGFSVNSKNTINDGNWHFAAFTINGTTLTLYVDGVSQGTTTITGTQGAPDGVMDIGANPPTFSFLRDNLFPGQIDETRVYNYPLTATQIQTLYNQGAAVRYGPTSGTPTP